MALYSTPVGLDTAGEPRLYCSGRKESWTTMVDNGDNLGDEQGAP